GGIHPGRNGAILHCRLRYFDPVQRRAGMPEDVAALVEKLTADQVALTLVNVNQLEARSVVVQAGGYAEHQFTTCETEGRKLSVDGTHFSVRLGPGAGAGLTIQMQRYLPKPT